eukprot:g10366.t1
MCRLLVSIYFVDWIKVLTLVGYIQKLAALSDIDIDCWSLGCFWIQRGGDVWTFFFSLGKTPRKRSVSASQASCQEL